MTQKEILRLLSDNKIPFVLVGGTAMRLYNSPRVTHDIDISVRTLDIDTIVDIMYSYNYFLVKSVSEEFCLIALNKENAVSWIEAEKAGSISLIQTNREPKTEKIQHQFIIVDSQVDFLFELSIPFTQLQKNARTINLKEFSFLVASPADLLTLKKDRAEDSASDREDIHFLERFFP